MSEAVDVAREYVECWNRRDLAAMRGCLHDDYTYMGGDGVVHDKDYAMAIAEMFAGAFPDGRLEVTAAHTAGDVAILEFVGRGTHEGDLMGVAPTGRTIEIHVCLVCDVRDGRIYAEHEYLDMATVFGQLGVAALPAAA